MTAIVYADASRQKVICTGIKLKPGSARAAPSLRMFRLAALASAGCLIAAPALAGEYTTFQHVEMPSPATGDCRSVALLDLPAAWHEGDGAVVLQTSGPPHDNTRDQLVAALLIEGVAVLERVAAPCDAVPGRDDGIARGMLRALDAMTAARGAGPVVAIGYGHGSSAVLDVLYEPATGGPGINGPRYAAAASIGDGAPAFKLGVDWRTGGQAGGLAPLCRALTAVAAGMGATPQRETVSIVAETCTAGMPNQASVVAGAAR